ncbi:hypothetical protein RJT34_00216 [Clitoria ternatea]|uniref:Late embryogenesis abundant protein LEA-2 subgroup domain-containing protein n=1 Tax=Clitoria ternatea TaxID=43366 RepID=A0AAN9KFR3_CLITE
MADRVHPRNSPPVSGDIKTSPSQEPSTVPANPSSAGGTYVIQIPKDQVYRVPPPENARRYSDYSGRKTRRCRCCCCLCWFISFIIGLIILLGIAAGILYLIVRPKAPEYSIDTVSVKGMNLTLPSSTVEISPEFDVTVRAANSNGKIGIYYEAGSSVQMFYREILLCDGALPAFYQPSNNVTVFETVLKSNGIELTTSDQAALVKAVAQRSVPLQLKLRAPVKVKVGSVKSWKITVKVDCDVTVDELTARAKIVHKVCSYGVDLW